MILGGGNDQDFILRIGFTENPLNEFWQKSYLFADIIGKV
jgi:hypothetical protein